MKIQLLPAMLLLSAACSTATAFAQAAPTDKMADKATTTSHKMNKKAKDTMAPAADATAPATAVKKTKTHKGGPTVNASGPEIADAQAKGLVWVNTGTGVYHKGGDFFGATKEGKFMTEAEAQTAKYRAAKEPGHADKPAQSAAKMAKPSPTK